MKGFASKYSNEFQMEIYNLILAYASSASVSNPIVLNIRVTGRNKLGCIMATQTGWQHKHKTMRLVKSFWKPVKDSGLWNKMRKVRMSLETLKSYHFNTVDIEKQYTDRETDLLVDYRIEFSKRPQIMWM